MEMQKKSYKNKPWPDSSLLSKLCLTNRHILGCLNTLVLIRTFFKKCSEKVSTAPPTPLQLRPCSAWFVPCYAQKYTSEYLRDLEQTLLSLQVYFFLCQNSKMDLGTSVNVNCTFMFCILPSK